MIPFSRSAASFSPGFRPLARHGSLTYNSGRKLAANASWWRGWCPRFLSSLEQDHLDAQAKWLKRFDAQEKGLKKCKQRISDLTTEMLEANRAKEEFERTCRIRAAIERTTYPVLKKEALPYFQEIQEVINTVAKTHEFQVALKAKVQKHGLVYKDVMRCLQNIYHEVSKHEHGKNRTLVIRDDEYGPNERAALVTLLEMGGTRKEQLILREIAVSKGQ